MDLLEYKHIKQNRTTRHLISAIVSLVENYSIDKITTTMITEAAEINRTTFYNYFKDKYDLINYVYYCVVKNFDSDFSRYDTFIKGSIAVSEALIPYAAFMKAALAYKSQNSLQEFITSYWVRFNKKLYKESCGTDSVSLSLNLAIEMWVHALVDEMTAASNSKYANMSNHDYAKIQLERAPDEIKKALIQNSIKSGVLASEMILPSDINIINSAAYSDIKIEYKNFMNLKSCNTLDSIYHAVLSLVKITKPENITIAMICAEAGITRDDFLNYLPDALSAVYYVHYKNIADHYDLVNFDHDFRAQILQFINNVLDCQNYYSSMTKMENAIAFKIFMSDSFYYESVGVIELVFGKPNVNHEMDLSVKMMANSIAEAIWNWIINPEAISKNGLVNLVLQHHFPFVSRAYATLAKDKLFPVLTEVGNYHSCSDMSDIKLNAAYIDSLILKMKEWLSTKNINSLTVVDLCMDCKIPVNEFNEYFYDIKDFVNFMFYKDLELVFTEHQVKSLRDVFINMTGMIYRNKVTYEKLIVHTDNSILRRFAEEFFKYKLVLMVNDLNSKELKLNDINDDIEFYVDGCVAYYFKWITDGCIDSEKFVNTCMRHVPDSLEKVVNTYYSK